MDMAPAKTRREDDKVKNREALSLRGREVVVFSTRGCSPAIDVRPRKRNETDCWLRVGRNEISERFFSLSFRSIDCSHAYRLFASR